MTFKDYFSVTAEDYARSRPRYPDALFDYLASLCARRNLAWDCATGNGQAALGLAVHFERVLATDSSQRQIENALPHPKVSYLVAPAETSGLKPTSTDLVTIAQALHWLDLPRFYAEVMRVLVPTGVFAAWSYNRLSVDPAVDAVVSRYYEDIVGPYWPAERALVEKGYVTLSFPFEEIKGPAFVMEERWDLSRLLAYLATWSATRGCQEATGRDPREIIRSDLLAAWGDPLAEKAIRWPLTLRIGRT